ncbi:uncharacterized protein LODBEIA_P21700 [Lodderomyces beijingensis]|uniref:thioredoxin-dependent peroxiredoxin n=1 Tax=Lodderomyces beijingensis TaxID=1775926 RepID=A0ABP0ZIG8_9ASCO
MTELRRSARVAAQPAKEEAPAAFPPAKKAKKDTTAPKATPKAEPKKASDNGEDAEEIQVGDKIPDITLLNQDEEEVDLSAIAKANKYVVIFAYPKASTPGCTRQVCGFQKNYKFLTDNDVAVFGLSSDEPKAQKSFQTKQGAEYDLLSDPEKQLLGVLGAKKSPSGIKRSHWIFKDGVLAVKEIQISPEQSFEGAKEDIEKFIAEAKPEAEANGDEKKGEEKEEVLKENGDDKKEENGDAVDKDEAKDSQPVLEPKEEAREEEGYKEDDEGAAPPEDAVAKDAVEEAEDKIKEDKEPTDAELAKEEEEEEKEAAA